MTMKTQAVLITFSVALISQTIVAAKDQGGFPRNYPMKNRIGK